MKRSCHCTTAIQPTARRKCVQLAVLGGTDALLMALGSKIDTVS